MAAGYVWWLDKIQVTQIKKKNFGIDISQIL